MSSMLVFGLLIGCALLTLVDAGSWSVAVRAVKPAQRNNTLRLSDVYGQSLFSYSNQAYRGTVYVGTPPEPFTVLFDTGSSIFWIPKKGCQSSGPLVRHCNQNFELYDPSVSVTAEPTNNHFYIKYGTGSVRGHYYTDYLTFGGSLRFKEPIMVGAGEVMEHGDEGIVGLASLNNPDNPGTSVMHEAWRQKVLDEPIFTIHMRKCPVYEDDRCHDGGLITFGGVDKINCDKVDVFHPIDPNSYHWQFNVSEFQIGRAYITDTIKAISDSGSNRLVGPKGTVQKLLDVMGATAVEWYHTVKCDTNARVTLTINGHMYTIPSHNMLLNLHNGYCQVLLSGLDTGNLWILGTPFTQTYCAVHNIEKRTIGFPKAKN